MTEPANFSASDRFGRNFPTVQNSLQKRKKLHLIKLVSQLRRAIRKGHASFLLFHFWDFKLVPIDSALNSTLGNLTHLYFKSVSAVTKKVAKLESCFFLERGKEVEP